MSPPIIHGDRPVFSASAALDAVGSELSLIRQQDRLTWADMGAVLGVSEDQAAKYAAASAAMSVVTYARGKREWNGRFTGALDRLCQDSRPAAHTDHGRLCHVLAASAALAEALRDDGRIGADEVRQNRRELECARDAIDDLLGRLGPREARA